MRCAEPVDEAERRYGVELRYALLPDECGGAVLQRRGARTWIIVDLRLSPVEQRCRIAHELCHLDRGSMRCAGLPSTWDDLVAREERRTDGDVADWLVDDHDLWVLIGDLVAIGDEPTTKIVAQEFQVTRHIARIALERTIRRHHFDRLAG